MNRSEIRKKLGVKKEVKFKKFIYFLIMDKVVVYIGQTTSLELRISKHNNDGKKFEDFNYIECHPDEANQLEAENIVKYNPKYNFTLPRNDLYKSKHFFKSVICQKIDAMIDEINPRYIVRTDLISHINSSRSYSVEQIAYANLKISECFDELVLCLNKQGA